jgi:arylsulfatase A-like enzyme
MRLTPVRPLGRIVSWSISVWCIHAILRFLVLARVDAFGHAFVGKLHWYLFHAWCFDAKWIAIGALPFLAHAWFWEKRSPRYANMALWVLVVVHSALLMATVADHELQRFLGSHLTPSVLETYGNTAAVREVPNFFGSDQSIPYLPMVLFWGVPFLVIGLWKGIESRGWIGPRPWRAAAWFAGFALVGWIYTDIAWKGGNRAAKLAPVVEVWWKALHVPQAQAMTDSVYAASARNWQASWLSEAGSDTAWTFPDSSRPFWRVPTGDTGVVTDSLRRNVVLIVIETGRALDIGVLKEWGATASATPFLDSMARSGRLWTRYTCPSMPTVRALMSIHLGVWDHPNRNIATSYPALSHRSIPNILNDHGWRTHFFTAADPAWDNETPWLGRWYQGFDYSSSRERDGDMMAYAAAWMRDSIPADKPFFVAMMTKSNHYPFDQIREWTREKDLRKRLALSLGYTDSCIKAFVQSVSKESWFAKTVFVVTGDHGFPLGEHGPGNMGHGLFTESVWLPLIAWGGHPSFATPAVSSIPASHLDLGPTVLRLAGVRAANHFAGHDLLDSARSDSALVVQSHWDEVAGQRGVWRGHGTLGGGAREKGPQLFRMDVDPRQEHDSAKGRESLHDTLVAQARSRVKLLVEVLRRDRLSPEKAN